MLVQVSLLMIFGVLQVSKAELSLPSQEDTVKEQMELYCSKIQSAFDNVNNIIYRFTNIGGRACEDISSVCMKVYDLPKIVDNKLFSKSPANVVFLNTKEESVTLMKHFNRVEDNRAVYHVVFCSETDDKIAKTIIGKIEKGGLAYTVVVYVSSKTLNVLSYDRYAVGSPHLNFTENYDKVFARRPKSLKNSKVVLSDTEPNIIIGKDYLRCGADELIDALETCFHDKISRVKPRFTESFSAKDIELMLTGDYIFCTKPVLYTEEVTYSVTYPIKIENLVVLVPRAKVENEVNYIFNILNYKIIICFFVILIIVSFLSKNLTLGMGPFPYFDVLFDHFGSFLGLPVEGFGVKRSVFLLAWLIFSLIVTVQFKGIFLNDIFDMQQERVIHSIKELKQTKLSIYISFEMRHIANHVNARYLKDQIKYKNSLFITTSILNNSKQIYVVTDTAAKEFLNLRLRHLIKFDYRVLRQKLASFLIAYPQNKQNTMKNEINDCLLQATDSGIQKSSFVSWPKLSLDNDDDNKMMKFIHFVGVFILLFIGYLISFTVFIMELIYAKMRARAEEEDIIVPFVN